MTDSTYRLLRNALPVTWGEMGQALTALVGEERATATVEQLRAREGVLNVLDQCGDLRRLCCPVDGGLVAMERGEVATGD